MRNNFRRDNRGGRNFDRGGFGRRNPEGAGDRGRRQMFKAVCANCGKACEVPFRPTNSRPVYCSECFEKLNRGERNDRQNDRPGFNDRRPQGDGGSDQTRAQFESLNNKLDRIITLLENKTEAVKTVKEPLLIANEVKAEVGKTEKETEKDVLEESPKVKKTSKKTSATKK